jgi:hypothetical protein
MFKLVYDHLPCYEVARNDDGLFDIFKIYTKNQKTLCLITIIITLLELSLDARMRSNLLTRQLGRLRR